MSISGKLMKDTAVYGLSSILARMLNFLLVPLYTRKLTTGDFGVYSDILAYIAIFQVVLVFGMETGFFRFASLKDRNATTTFNTISTFLLCASVLFFGVMCAFSVNIASLMGYLPIAVVYAAGILATDSYTSVLFARLRFQQKPLKFALIRSAKILSEVFFNLLFIFLLPVYFQSNPQSFLLNFFTPQVSYVYVLAAIFCSSIVPLFFFTKDILTTPLKISRVYLNDIFLYSFPLMLAGLQGVANDFVDRIMFRFLAPENEMTWSEQLGLFSANARLAVIMALFVQMFRYAAEPFFFASSEKGDIKAIYARVTKHFTIFCAVVFMFVAMNADFIKYILGKEFRSGIVILPIMLIANLLGGINQNMSIWYKLSSQTKKAIIITFFGLLTTILVNTIFMPLYGYKAAAWGHPASYLVMILISWQLSKKYYKIPYEWPAIISYILAALAVYGVSLIIPGKSMLIGLLINTLMILAFIVVVAKIEGINARTLKKIIRK